MITPVTKVMTKKLFTAPEGTSLSEASRMMKEKRIRHLPIVDVDDEVVGVLSQRDLNMIPESKNLTVEMMMSSPVVSVNKCSPLRKTILTMLEKKISSLLVVDDDSEVMGIVTTDDMLWHLAYLLNDEKEPTEKMLPIDRMRTIGEFASRMANVGI